MKNSIASGLCFILLLPGSAAWAQDQKIRLFPITDVLPEYPVEAFIRGTEGWVWVEFSVSAEGTVSEVIVRDSEPLGVFDAAALQAIEQFEYAPQSENGRAISTKNVFHMFKFRPST